MRTKLALLLVLALLAAGLLVPAAAQAQDDEANTYEIPVWIGLVFGEWGWSFPGPNITAIPVEEGSSEYFSAITDWFGYPRDPVVGDTIKWRTGWGTFGKGGALTLPLKSTLSVEVLYAPDETSDPVTLIEASVSAEDAMQYWKDPELVMPPDIQPFNPRIGAPQWVIYWLTDGFVAEEEGYYGVHFYYDWTMPVNDLTAIEGEDGWLDKFAGHLHYRPGGGLRGDGVTDSYFYFYVAP